MKRSDVLLLIAIWQFLTAAGALIGIIAIAVFAFPDTNDAGGYFGLSIATVILLAYFGLAVAAGVGLLMVQRWGRVAAIVHAALSLLSIPFGTIIGALTLAYLLRSKTREYFETAPEKPSSAT